MQAGIYVQRKQANLEIISQSIIERGRKSQLYGLCNEATRKFKITGTVQQ
jgi:hypothetical protein